MRGRDRWAGWRACAFRRRGMVLLAWLLALGLAIGLSAAFGGEIANGASPAGLGLRAGTDACWSERFPAQSGDRVEVVVRADDVAGAEVRASRSRRCSVSWDACRTSRRWRIRTPPRLRVSPDGRTLVARVYLDVTNPNDMPVEDTERLLAAAAEAERDGLEVALSGRAVQLAEAPEPGSTEMLGLIAAAVILLITFGSLVAAGLPLAMAIGGLVVSSSLVGLAAAVVDVPDFAPLIGAMLGIAVGIDYALLMVTRFREWRAVGLDPETATVATLDTAGRAVLVAGGTVIVSMARAVRDGPVHHERHRRRHDGGGAGRDARRPHPVPRAAGLPGAVDRPAAAAAGRRRCRPALQPTATWSRRPAGCGGAGWCSGTARSPLRVASLCSSYSPCRSSGVQFAHARRGQRPRGHLQPAGHTTCWPRASVRATSGPLLVVADLRGADGGTALERLHASLEAAAGVAAVSPPRVNPAGDTALITVVPTTGPQDDATVDLVHTVRDDVIPAAIGGHRCPGATSAGGPRRRSTSTRRSSTGLPF